MKLTAYKEDSNLPKRIVVEIGQIIATIYRAGTIEFSAISIYPEQVKEILTIAENFELFYENVEMAN